MENLKQKIIEYFEDYKTEDELFEGSFEIAKSVAIFAHRNQCRDNDEPYIGHPARVSDSFARLISVPTKDKLVPQDIVESFNIPTLGVFEVCLLHDVIEDTDIKINDIREIYVERGLESAFDVYIKEPIELITHNKEEDYDAYISKVLTNKTASLVKMLDMIDNINVLGLRTLSSKELERCHRYLDYVKLINGKYKFLENAFRARNAYQDQYYEKLKNT